MERIIHPIPPVYDNLSEILILGSFPSVKSREGEFFYHHPRNRFWLVISSIYKEPVPVTIQDKKEFLLRNRIAVWDVIESCEITGSADSSIKNVIANDITRILSAANVRKIYTNGNTASSLYQKYILPKTGREGIKLPSTSPANAGCKLEQLIEAWSCIKL
jgi:G:T/U mismatch-specific DNA glycosylase